MSAFIKLNKQDAFITPYTAHKTWTVSNTETGSYGIRVYTAVSSSGEIYIDQATPTTDSQYAELVYKNLQHLYYSGVSNNQATSSRYETYEQSTLNQFTSRELPVTASVISIPKSIFGHALRPGSIAITGSGFSDNYVSQSYVSGGYIVTETYDGFSLYDDGEGVLRDTNKSGAKVGDVIYSHGQIIVTNQETVTELREIDSYTLTFQSSLDIYTHNYSCRSNQSQLNYSLHPSTYNNTAQSGSINDNVTGSYFQPYVTTIGLYNDAHELIAVGKLPQPIPKSKHVDMTFVVNFDI